MVRCLHKYVCHKYMDSVDLFPKSTMDDNKKILVTLRLVFILSILGYMLSSNNRFLYVGFFTACCIGGMYYYKKYVDKSINRDVEPFVNIDNNVQLEKVLQSEYSIGTKTNPLANVLMTDYTDNPYRKSAPPAFNDVGIETVNKNVKKAVQELNPTIENTSKQLFGGLYNQFELNNANRAFFATPNTKIPNDQGAFANFLYGDMPSCKEDGLQCIKDNARYNLY